MTAFLKDVVGYGTHAARPAAGSAGALYFESDRGRLFRDNGTTWDALDPFTTAGDLAYFDGTHVSRLAVSTDGDVLTLVSGEPAWAAGGGGGGGGPFTASRLDWNASTDLANNLAPSASTWTDLSANQSFTISGSSGLAVVQVSGGGLTFGASGGATGVSSRVIVDSAGTPITKTLAAGAIPISSWAAWPLTGSVFLSGLSAGSHTIKVQIYAGGSGLGLYCRCSTVPNTEFLGIRVLEAL